jgi:hypothetical protein
MYPYRTATIDHSQLRQATTFAATGQRPGNVKEHWRNGVRIHETTLGPDRTLLESFRPDGSVKEARLGTKDARTGEWTYRRLDHAGCLARGPSPRQEPSASGSDDDHKYHVREFLNAKGEPTKEYRLKDEYRNR